MRRLLFMELKRAIASPVLWIGVIAVVIMRAYEILLSSYGFAITATTFLLENTSVICIFMAVFIPLHIGQEFEERTVNNKIAVGYTRKQIYITEMIVSAVYGLILLTIDTVSIFIFSAIKHLQFSNETTLTSFFLNFIISSICIITISSFFTLIVMIAHRRLISIAIALMLSLFMLQIGGNTVSYLIQPEYRYDTESNEMVENPLYLTGAGRTASNAHLLLSPFAQVKYEPYMLFETVDEKQDNSLIMKQYPYHLEFCLLNLIEIILLLRIGIFIYNKQDLK